MFDMLILGYGPAGISAALYGLRAGLSVQLVGKDGGALAKAHMIQNYYGLEKPLSGEQLLEVGHKQAIALGANIADDEITDLMCDGQGFSAKGLVGEYHGKVCIMATGAARNKHPVAGMAELEGHGVSYCAVCDAFFYRQKNVAVLGNGEYALHEVQELLSVVKSVTLLTNGAALATSFPPVSAIASTLPRSYFTSSHMIWFRCPGSSFGFFLMPRLFPLILSSTSSALV